MIEMIVAKGLNNEIGFEGKLLWNLKDDMEHFVKTTKGKMVVMGRKTFDSLPKGPLKGRTNIVLTNGKKAHYEVDDTTEVFFMDYQEFKNMESTHDFIVIGGAQIYKLFIDKTDKLYLTSVQGTFEADAFFPMEMINKDEWIPGSPEVFEVDERNDHAFHIIEITRKR